MLSVHSFTFNPFQENTYIIINEKKHCWIIDPGMYDSNETKRVTDFIATEGLSPQAIINTHAHIDHIFGIQALKDAYNIPFGLHEKDLPVLQNAVGSAMMFGLDFKKTPTVDFYLEAGKPYALGDDDALEVRFTPGHAPGHVVFYNAKSGWVINGDVLFQQSIGRTDLPGGNFDTLINSIRTQLFTLPDETTVYTGHGPATTIGEEKLNNPFLQD